MSEQSTSGTGGPDAGRPDAKQAWSDAGERLQGLGHRFKEHYDAQAGEHGETRVEVKEAVKRLGEAVTSAFEAIGTAAKDPAVKDDARLAGKSVADALVGTFSGLGEELRRTFGTKSEAGPAASPHAWPSDDPSAPPPAAATEPGAPAPGTPPPPATTPPPAPGAPSYGTPPESAVPVEPTTGLPEERQDPPQNA